jgi:hypothetical protein
MSDLPEMPTEWNLNGGNIKCDTSGCGYAEPVNFTKLNTYVDMPCPRCGAPLLTEADYKATLKLNEFMCNPLVRWFNEFGKVFGMTEKFHVKMDKGDMEVKKC